MVVGGVEHGIVGVARAQTLQRDPSKVQGGGVGLVGCHVGGRVGGVHCVRRCLIDRETVRGGEAAVKFSGVT